MHPHTEFCPQLREVHEPTDPQLPEPMIFPLHLWAGLSAPPLLPVFSTLSRVLGPSPSSAKPLKDPD